MKSSSARPFVLVLLFLIGAAPALHRVLGDSRPRDPGETTRSLRVGEAWTHSDGGLTITFLEVLQDNRLSARNRNEENRSRRRAGRDRGNAAVSLLLEAGSQSPKTVVIHTRREPSHQVIAANEFPSGVSGIPKSYLVSIRRLLPAASKRGDLRAQGAYRIRLRVDVAL